MKKIIIFLSIIICSFATLAQGKGKDIVTESFLVSGNCGSCEERIEKAAYIKGVKRAEWDSETKKLTVIYRPSKTSKKQILRSIADSGHDSESFTAEEENYEKLPDCCRYRTGACTEEE